MICKNLDKHVYIEEHIHTQIAANAQPFICQPCSGNLINFSDLYLLGIRSVKARASYVGAGLPWRVYIVAFPTDQMINQESRKIHIDTGIWLHEGEKRQRPII